MAMRCVASSIMLVLLLAFPALAQVDCEQGMESIDRSAVSRMSPTDFTQEVGSREALLAKAFATYGYTVEIDVETLQGETVDGVFHRKIVVTFDSIGRSVKTVEAPTSTLTRIKLSDKDVETLVVPPFAVTIDNLAEKDVVYSGRQPFGGHDASVFDLLPRSDLAPLRGFIGRTWVWARTATILKTCGRSSAFPVGPFRYEVVRGPVGQDNWFPTLIRADEQLRGSDGSPVRVRVTAKYSDYVPR